MMKLHIYLILLLILIIKIHLYSLYNIFSKSQNLKFAVFFNFIKDFIIMTEM